MVLSWASLGGEERRCLLRFGRARWSPGNANWWRSRSGSDRGSAGPKPGRPLELFSTACCRGSRAKQAGFWLSRPGLSGPTACSRCWGALEETTPAAMADALAREAWATHAAGEGAKGLRLYEWARIALSSTAAPGFEHWLLIRRSRREPDKRASYFAFAPVGVALGELAGAAGLRGTIEACFERAKDDLGFDHCEARSWHGWHRHMSLCLELVLGGGSLPGPVGRRPASGDMGQSERKESGGPSGRLMSLAALLPSVPEIRSLLARRLLRPPI